METDDISLMVFQEILKIGKNSKNNYKNMLLLEILFILIVQHKFQLIESCKDPKEVEELMIIHKLLKKDLKLFKIRPYQLSEILKKEVTASKQMQQNQDKKFMKN